jgi:hypothetical protein
MQSNLNQRRSTLEGKIPDIKKTLSMVEFLQERRVRTFDRRRFWTSLMVQCSMLDRRIRAKLTTMTMT